MRLATCVLLLFITACMTKPTDYSYADGSANVYELRGHVLEYIPVKPEESSTGTYSGGEPKTVTISTQQRDTLQSLFEKAILNTAVHQKDRAKGTGAITMIKSKEEQRYILRMGCAEIGRIEEALKKFLQ